LSVFAHTLRPVGMAAASGLELMRHLRLDVAASLAGINAHLGHAWSLRAR
jgi:hypothetical protein